MMIGRGFYVMSIGERIKAKRLELELTQEDLATRMGYKHKSSIQKIESGEADIVQSKVVAFAHALNTTVAYLMGWEEEEKLRRIEEDTAFIDLKNTWIQMTEDQKHTLVSLAHALLNTESQHKH